MHLRFAVPLVPLFILMACGPGKDTTEGTTSNSDTTSDGTTGDGTTGDGTTGDGITSDGTSGDGTTGDAPTGTTTGTSDAMTGTGTGTTGDAGQPLFCEGEPANQPACVDVCVRDLDPETSLVNPNCQVIETRADMTTVELPACILANDSWEPPAGDEACFVLLIDKDGKQTPSSLDDMSLECVDDGHNAEIKLIRSVPAMDGACAVVTCEPSPNIMRDCPNL